MLLLFMCLCLNFSYICNELDIHIYVCNTTLILTHTQEKTSHTQKKVDNKEKPSSSKTSSKKRQTEENRNSQAKKKRKKSSDEKAITLQKNTRVAQYWPIQNAQFEKNFNKWVWLPGTVLESKKDGPCFKALIRWNDLKLDNKLVYKGEMSKDDLSVEDHVMKLNEIDLYQDEDAWVKGVFADKVMEWQAEEGLKGLQDFQEEETLEESSSSVSLYNFVVVYCRLPYFYF